MNALWQHYNVQSFERAEHFPAVIIRDWINISEVSSPVQEDSAALYI